MVVAYHLDGRVGMECGVGGREDFWHGRVWENQNPESPDNRLKIPCVMTPGESKTRRPAGECQTRQVERKHEPVLALSEHASANLTSNQIYREGVICISVFDAT